MSATLTIRCACGAVYRISPESMPEARTSKTRTRVSAIERVSALLTEEWRDTYDLADELGRSRSRVTGLLNELLAEGRAERRLVRGRAQWARTPMDTTDTPRTPADTTDTPS
jgi:hypothetical protein